MPAGPALSERVSRGVLVRGFLSLATNPGSMTFLLAACWRDSPPRARWRATGLIHTFEHRRQVIFQTLSGPRDTVIEARAALTEAGYFVLGAPRPEAVQCLAPTEGEALLSVESSDSYVVRAIEHLDGWRHRMTMTTPQRAVGIGGQG